MKIYVENTAKELKETMMAHMTYLLIDRFKTTENETRRQIGLIRDFKTSNITVFDIGGVPATIESTIEYGQYRFKVTATDSSYQIESDLMDIDTWKEAWAWLEFNDTVPAVKPFVVFGDSKKTEEVDVEKED